MMMNSIFIGFFSMILFLFIDCSNGRDLFDSTLNDYYDSDTSSLFENLLTNSTESISTTNTNDFILSFTSNQSFVPVENGSMDLIIEQVNTYRHTQISARIEKCDSNIQLNDLCEFYSFNYFNNSLDRRTIEHFESLENIFHELINQTIIENFKQYCFSVNICRDNLPDNNIQSIVDLILKYGNTFCSLEQCHSRIATLLDSCPTLTNAAINRQTLELLPMLCSLYNQQSIWSKKNCRKELVHLFYIFYTFGTEIQTCYKNTSSNSNICSIECQITSYVLNNLADECYDHTLFLSKISNLSGYSSINIEEICDEKNSSTKPRLIYFMEKYFRRRRFWYHFYDLPMYIVSILIVMSLLMVCLCLYCCMKSKSRLKSNNRRFENDYEYTRLNDQSFELANSSQISNGDSIENESEINSTDQSRSFEYQRLLFVNS